MLKNEDFNAAKLKLAQQSSYLRVAYIGARNGTSLHRAGAMQRLGHDVTIIDPMDFIGHSKWIDRWFWRSGGMGSGLFWDKAIFQACEDIQPELIWVNQGDFLGPQLIERLGTLGTPVVNYTNDDPFGRRDGNRFRQYRRAMPYYDLVAVVREDNVLEAKAHGARAVMRVWMSADEIAHHPREIGPKDFSKWGSDVCFIGTWMPERGPFMAKLVKAGIPLSIWGDRWQKADEWPLLAPHWRGPAQNDPDIYARIIQTAKICIGMLSVENRDLHTTRSIEIPALGGLLCAERTDEHLALYEEGTEALFWNDSEECIAKLQTTLANDTLREIIKLRGRVRSKKNGVYNENIINKILAEIGRIDSPIKIRNQHIQRNVI